MDRPTVYTIDELKRLPSESHIYFVECSGNSGREWKAPGAGDVQKGFGLASCSEWTGVPVRLLLEEAGLQKGAKWMLAEGADACKLFRSLPLDKVLKDGLVAYAQNGEAIRPSQGYPLRLIVPGYEGNTNIKWLRQLKVVDQPYMAKDETSKYTDLMPDGRARQFTFEMDAKSVITHPSGGTEAGWSRLLRNPRAGMDRAWPDREGGGQCGWRRDVEGRATSRAAIGDGVHTVPDALGMGWQRSSDHE